MVIKIKYKVKVCMYINLFLYIKTGKTEKFTKNDFKYSIYYVYYSYCCKNFL